MYDIGIDGGGTKTRLCVTDESGKTVCEAAGGGSSLTSLSAARVEENLRGVLGAAFRKGIREEDCAALCLGSAGAMDEGVRARLEAMLRRVCPSVPSVTVVSDSVGALSGAFADGRGVLLVSGTGSVGIALGKANVLARVGGWGHLVDDDGSGYEIGRQILRAVLGAYDGRRPETALTRALLDRLRVRRPPEVLPYVYGDLADKSRIAALAPLCEDACAQGDGVARAIVRDAALALHALYRAACAQAKLGEEERKKCVLTGSVGEKFGALRAELAARMREDGAELALPLAGAAEGCCKIARAARKTPR